MSPSDGPIRWGHVLKMEAFLLFHLPIRYPHQMGRCQRVIQVKKGGGIASMNSDIFLGVDIGYGFTKTFNSGGRKMFPTAVTTMIPRSTFREIETITANGERFLVAENALLEGKWVLDTRNTGFVRSNGWLAVLGHSLSINDYNPDEIPEGLVVLGIPPGLYTKEAATGLVEFIKGSTILYRSKEYTFRNGRIKVIPQGAGVFFHYTSHFPEDFLKEVAIVDIGHYTVDMIYFSGGNYIEGTTVSKSMGLSFLWDEIQKEFFGIHNLSISQEQAQKLFERGRITILQKEYTLDSLSEKVSSYCDKISSLINGFFENFERRPEIGLAAGGGVLALEGRVKLKHKLHLVDDAAYSNSVGFWQYARGTDR